MMAQSAELLQVLQCLEVRGNWARVEDPFATEVSLHAVCTPSDLSQANSPAWCMFWRHSDEEQLLIPVTRRHRLCR